MGTTNSNEIRCVCSRNSLLGVFLFEDGIPYVHQKTYKGDIVYSESILKGGTVKIRCRACAHWTTVNLTRNGELITHAGRRRPKPLGQ